MDWKGIGACDEKTELDPINPNTTGGGHNDPDNPQKSGPHAGDQGSEGITSDDGDPYTDIGKSNRSQQQ